MPGQTRTAPASPQAHALARPAQMKSGNYKPGFVSSEFDLAFTNFLSAGALTAGSYKPGFETSATAFDLAFTNFLSAGALPAGRRSADPSVPAE
jgi:hypothetical protein